MEMSLHNNKKTVIIIVVAILVCLSLAVLIWGFGIWEMISKVDMTGREDNMKTQINMLGTEKSEGCVIFLHSGGFVLKKNDFHEQFGRAMAEELNYDYVVPDYPINQTYKETIESMEYIYKKAQKYDKVLMIGCSAGANLAVSTMISYGDKYGMPSGLILLSPWMDTAMTNEEIQCVSDFDKEFYEGLIEWGAQYNGGETDNALASPVNATREQLKDFPKTVMIVGTEDILRYDAKIFYENLEEAGVDVFYWDAEGRNHGQVFADYASTYVMPEIMTKAMREFQE